MGNPTHTCARQNPYPRAQVRVFIGDNDCHRSCPWQPPSFSFSSGPPPSCPPLSDRSSTASSLTACHSSSLFHPTAPTPPDTRAATHALKTPTPQTRTKTTAYGCGEYTVWRNGHFHTRAYSNRNIPSASTHNNLKGALLFFGTTGNTGSHVAGSLPPPYSRHT